MLYIPLIIGNQSEYIHCDIQSNNMFADYTFEDKDNQDPNHNTIHADLSEEGFSCLLVV